MSAPFVDFTEIKAAVSIEQVLSMLGIATKQEGQKLRGACPFCKDPRAFVVTPAAGKDARGLWGCFKCSKRGDSIGLVAQINGIKKQRGRRAHPGTLRPGKQYSSGAEEYSSEEQYSSPTAPPAPRQASIRSGSLCFSARPDPRSAGVVGALSRNLQPLQGGIRQGRRQRRSAGYPGGRPPGQLSGLRRPGPQG